MPNRSRPVPRSFLLAALLPALAAGLQAQLSYRQVTEWTRLQPASNPPSRMQFGFAFDPFRDRAVRFGGFLLNNSETWEFDGSNWLQRAPAQSPSPRHGFGMTFDPLRRRVVLFGGWDAATSFADTWTWNGTTWSNVSPFLGPTARFGHKLTFHPGLGRVVMYGGTPTDTWTWDGANWSPVPTTTNPGRHIWPAMAYDARRGRVVLFGGSNGAAELGDTWEFDGANWSQSALPQSPPARFGSELVEDPSAQRLVLFGGEAYTPTIFGDTWAFDEQGWRQLSSSPSPAAQTGVGMVADTVRGRVLLNAGGETWVHSGGPTARTTPAAATIPTTGQTLLFGGWMSTQPSGETWTWNGKWLRQLPAISPSPRATHAMAATANELVLFGGYSAAATLGDTWLWNGSTWSQAASPSTPRPRYGHAMVRLDNRDSVLLYGGIDANNVVLGDTWEWRNHAWTWQNVLSPASRAGHGMAYDGGRNRVVVFGGYDLTGYWGDTWEMDASTFTWNLRSPAHSPQARTNMAMQFDASRQRTVLFGGAPSIIGYLADTWEWDGSDWMQITPTQAPPGRSSPVFLGEPGGLVLFGGRGGRGLTTLGDTWRYNTATPAAWSTYGAGCGVIANGLHADPHDLAVLGRPYRVLLDNVPSTSPLAMFLVSFAPGSAPLDPWGATGCQLLMASPSLYFRSVAAGRAVFDTVLPNLPVLAGASFYVQGVATQPSANPLGWSMSNGVAMQIGRW